MEKSSKATTTHCFCIWISVQLLSCQRLVVIVTIWGCCCGDTRVCSLTETRRGFSLALNDSGKGMWLVIGWFFLAFQGHRVSLAPSLAYLGSAPPLHLLSLTTGEETQNWQEVRGKWTLRSLDSLSALAEIILHLVHSDFCRYFSPSTDLGAVLFPPQYPYHKPLVEQ